MCVCLSHWGKAAKIRHCECWWFWSTLSGAVVERGQLDPSMVRGRVSTTNCFRELKYTGWPIPIYVNVKNILNNERKVGPVFRQYRQLKGQNAGVTTDVAGMLIVVVTGVTHLVYMLLTFPCWLLVMLLTTCMRVYEVLVAHWTCQYFHKCSSLSYSYLWWTTVGDHFRASLGESCIWQMIKYRSSQLWKVQGAVVVSPNIFLQFSQQSLGIWKPNCTDLCANDDVIIIHLA